MSAGAKTPSFKRPPVVEVAIGVQFKEPMPLRVVDYGLVWNVFRERYPEFQEQAPLAQVLETFGDEPRPVPQNVVAAEAFPRAPVRLWFANPKNGRLVQVQTDRFVFNWRKLSPDSDYPRYKLVGACFGEEYSRLLTVLRDLGHPAPVVDLCEVTYVNHIAAGEGWEGHGDLHRVFPTLQIPTLTQAEGTPEEADVRIRFSMMDSAGHPGRLHLRVFPAIRTTDGAKLFVVNLVARGRPTASTFDSVRQALLDGHDWVVTAFKDVTSKEMHAIWGLENGTA